MDKEAFKLLIDAIYNELSDISEAEELKGKAIERSINSKDDMENKAYIALRIEAENAICKHKNHIRNMLTHFMNSTKEENDE